MKFTVTVKEVWNQDYSVEAETKEEAIEKVNNDDGECIEGNREYNHSLDTDTWNVYDSEGELIY